MDFIHDCDVVGSGRDLTLPQHIRRFRMRFVVWIALLLMVLRLARVVWAILHNKAHFPTLTSDCRIQLIKQIKTDTQNQSAS